MLLFVAFGLLVSAAYAPGDAPAVQAVETGAPAAEVVTAIQRHFPEEYAALLDETRRSASASPGDLNAARAARARWMSQFLKRHLDGLTNAPAPLLYAINRRQLWLTRALARADVALCAEFASTGFLGRVDLPAGYQRDASEILVLMIEAAKQGAALPRDARRQSMSDDDVAALYASLLEVGDSTQVRAARPDQDAERTEAQEMNCRVALAAYTAIDKMPAEQAANVAAFFLRQSFSDGVED